MDITQTTYIPKKQLTVIFIIDDYDLPIQGLAIYRNRQDEQIIRFDCSETVGDKQVIYSIGQLCPEGLSYKIAQKEEFESCVGFHWSFNPDTIGVGRPSLLIKTL